MPKKIVLSYRRSDSGIVGRIFDRLIAHYGRETVFLDVDDIPFGIDFRDHIRSVLHECDALVAVVGSNWIGFRDHGQSRIMDNNDPVRMEIEAALQQSIPIIPALVDSAKMPKETDLPESLRDFGYRNAATLDAGRDFDNHIERLIHGIDQIVGVESTASRRVRIIIGMGKYYETVEPVGANRSRTIRVKIENGTNREIANGRLDILNLDPPGKEHKNFFLKDGITIGPHGHAFVGIAAYNEGTSQAPVGTWIRLLVPVPSAYFSRSLPGNLPLQPHTFCLRFSSSGGESLAEVNCRLWVDRNHLIHLEELDVSSMLRDVPTPNVAESSRSFAEPLAERIPIIDFVGFAGQGGWQVSGTNDLEAADLMDGLTQAGVDGVVQFWGRQSEEKPLVLVEQKHWQEYEFDWISVLHTNNNVSTRTQKFSTEHNRYVTGYIDIHLDRTAATRWLQSPDARAFKGRRDRKKRDALRG
jgi:hypothetical protein